MWKYIVWDKWSSVHLWERPVFLCSVFENHRQLFPTMAVPLPIPISSMDVSQVLHILASVWVCHRSLCSAGRHCSWTFSRAPSPPLYPFKWRISVCVLLTFSWDGLSLLLSFEHSLYITDTSFSLNTWFANTFSSTVTCLFILLIGSPTAKYFNFTKYNLLFFLMVIYFERETVWAREEQRERWRQRIPSRLRAVSTEPNAGLELGELWDCNLSQTQESDT